MSSDTAIAAERTDESSFWLLAGDCRIQLTGNAERDLRGHVLVVIKPDDTVLVHDITGYQPAAWITEAETVSIDHADGVITAVDGDQWLRIELKQRLEDTLLPGSTAGRPVGTCPDCRSTLVDGRGSVHCIGCDDRYGLPADAELLDDRCACGLPRMRVTRGDQLDLCIDRECEPLQEAVADRFDGTWPCPDTGCDGHLRIIHRGGLMAACDAYPDCDVQFSFPAGRVENTCGCGLPRFRLDGDSRCLDTACADA